TILFGGVRFQRAVLQEWRSSPCAARPTTLRGREARTGSGCPVPWENDTSACPRCSSHLPPSEQAAWHVSHAACCNRVRSSSDRPGTVLAMPTGLSPNRTARKTQAARYEPASVGWL